MYEPWLNCSIVRKISWVVEAETHFKFCAETNIFLSLLPKNDLILYKNLSLELIFLITPLAMEEPDMSFTLHVHYLMHNVNC